MERRPRQRGDERLSQMIRPDEQIKRAFRKTVVGAEGMHGLARPTLLNGEAPATGCRGSGSHCELLRD
jgi:hypothetical protein